MEAQELETSQCVRRVVCLACFPWVCLAYFFPFFSPLKAYIMVCFFYFFRFFLRFWTSGFLFFSCVFFFAFLRFVFASSFLALSFFAFLVLEAFSRRLSRGVLLFWLFWSFCIFPLVRETQFGDVELKQTMNFDKYRPKCLDESYDAYPVS